MKTIYLRSSDLQVLFADISKVIDGYAGATDDEQDGVYCHLIGDVEKTPATFKEDLTIDVPAVMAGAYHANLLAPDNFDSSIFKTQINKPNSPKHQFAQ
jgi:hypothetical protein